ncbi:MAG: YceI family protein [Flavobacteriales bacterium]|nr:YceI family protein [Flavobacteriales bacterium]MBK6752633.1 YceI family protein [Flavobacteriales bacterium]MBK7085427.1 YceI family protein [Flavobacteriales bacterium]MBK7270752.1 YceI family protein [Flavobacteriales bacterium]MBK7754712.1 YceI family protein [Flavobacteriales bacterium]
MTKHLILAALFAAPLTLAAQERYATRTGHISFHSDTPMEKIEAHNHKSTSVLDASTGAVEFAVLMKGFEFDKALMQEHFNENYVESDKFPKAGFKGKFNGLTADDLKKAGTKEVTAEGEMSMHGVTKPVTIKGTFTMEPTGAVKASSTFTIKPEDYNITIPGMVRDNIAKEITIKVQMDYVKM